MRVSPACRFAIAFAAFLAAGCGNSAEKGGDIQPAAETGAALGEDSSAAALAAPQDGESAPGLQTASTAAASASTALEAYVGQYRESGVDGVAWLDHPTVAAGIEASVSDPQVRRALHDTAGPSAPIELIDGKVSSWACQAHNCGDHQWMEMVDPATGATDVCYYDAAARPDEARWFLAAGREEWRAGNCTIE